MTPGERLWAKIDMKDSESECWAWLGSRNQDGYGQVWWDGRVQGAHRAVLEYETGLPLGDRQALHRCDNPPCCNPSHLFIGTPKDNARDRDAKGRRDYSHLYTARKVRGEEQGRAKLTQVQVDEIRAKYAAGGVRQIDLAREYGMSREQISSITRGAAWKFAEHHGRG